MSIIKTSFYFLVLLLISSCLSLNSNQTGRTLDEGNSNAYGSFSFGKLDNPYYLDVSYVGEYYIGEIGTSYGVKENLDLGISVNTSFHVTGKSKYQFIGNKESLFASSVGLDLGFGPFGLVLGVISYSSSLSIYNSFHINEHIAIIASPKFAFLGVSNISKIHRFDEYHEIYGYSTGFILGKKHQFSFEYSQFINNRAFDFQTLPQFSIGYIYQFKSPSSKY